MSTITSRELAQDTENVLGRVEAGEPIAVIRDGRPIAELRPLPPPRTAPRPFGLAAGAFAVPDNFDAPLPDDLLSEFEG